MKLFKTYKSTSWMLLLMPIIVVSSSASAQQIVTNASGVMPGTFFGAKPTTYPDWFKESFLEFSDDIAEAAEQDKRVLLLFHQDGCPYCNLLIERNFSQHDILDLVRKKFDVIAINIWGDREVVTVGGQPFTEKQFSAALQVQFTPTLLFFNEQGKAILKLNGYLPPREFLTAIRYVAEQHETKISYRNFVHQELTKTDASLKGLISQPFFQEPPHNLEDASGERPVAVFFEQQQCPNCENLHLKVLSDAMVAQYLEDFNVIQIDMWSDHQLINFDGKQVSARDWATSLEVSYAPTIVLFGKNGKEVIRSEAFFKKFHTTGLFQYVSSEAFLTQPNFQRYLSDLADHLVEQGIDVDIWE